MSHLSLRILCVCSVFLPTFILIGYIREKNTLTKSKISNYLTQFFHFGEEPFRLQEYPSPRVNEHGWLGWAAGGRPGLGGRVLKESH